MSEPDSPSHKTIRWGQNFLEFTRDAHNPGIWHCQHFRVDADLLDKPPKKIFETLLKRGWIKASEIKL